MISQPPHFNIFALCSPGIEAKTRCRLDRGSPPRENPAPMWKWIRKQMLRIPVLGDWIIGVDDSRAHAQLRKHYVPLIEKTRSAKSDLEVQNLYAEWNHNQTLIEEPNYVDASDRLVRKARGFYAPVPDRPTNYGAVSADWQMSNISGDWALTAPTYQRLQREVQVAQRAAN